MKAYRVIFALLPVAAWTGVFAQNYPSRPVRVVVPYAAGGNMEHWRPTLQRLSEAFGQTFVMDNRPGAGGNIGTDIVAKSAPDGHTLVIGTIGTHATNPSVYAKMPYDAVADFTPVILLATMPNVMAVHNGVPVRSVAEFVAHAKANPGKINFGSPGNGASAHLTGELFKIAAGVDMQHVPYKGSAPAVQDLIAGQIQVMFDNVPLPLQHIRAGRLRGLAVTTGKRSDVLPELPTLQEAGYPSIDVGSWYAIYGPARMPADIVARLNKAFNDVVQRGDARATLVSQGWTPIGGSVQQLADHNKAELARWAQVAKTANIRVE